MYIVYTMSMARNVKTRENNKCTVGVFIHTMIYAHIVIDFCGYIKSNSFAFDDYMSLSSKWYIECSSE